MIMNWQPIDYIISLLVLAIVIILIMTMSEVVFDDRALTDASSKRVTALLTSIISIIAMYVGAQIQKNRDK